MRVVVLLLVVLLTGCGDDTRVFEKNHDFENRFWPIADTPSFDFSVQDTTLPYAAYCNIRNSVSYPYSRIFVSYILKDSTGTELKKEMVSGFLFDQKTGVPLGVSGLGDIYDQKLPILKDFKFPHAGKYSVQFEQFMRTDSLQGILAVGLRVEKEISSHQD
jgi:gliding motility-associated lipoprotein GldH